MSDAVIFFETTAELRVWFEKNHDKLAEQWVGFWKKSTGKPSVTWPEVVDAALCFGWIDGIRKSIDAESYKNRITPRKARSIWSSVNIKRVGELIEMGLMTPSGIVAFEKRTESRSKVYAYEQETIEFSSEFLTKFKNDKKAFAYFESQPPSYRTPATWWVIRAKQEATRERRLAALIDDSANGIRVAHLRR